MPKEITVAELDQAEAELAQAKKSKNVERRAEASQRLADLRSAWRIQEEAAGRRAGFVGGDAAKEG